MRIRRSLPLFVIALNAAVLVVILAVVMRWPKHVRIPEEQPPAALALRERIGLLAPDPDWNELEPYQETLTRQEFESELREVFSVGDSWKAAVRVTDTHAEVDTQSGGAFRLRFAKTPRTAPPPRYWRGAAELSSADPDTNRPLKGMRIVIDPGHIGGRWARTEQRWYSIAGGAEVMEGTLTLRVARLLRQRLEHMGAQVFLTREQTEPATNLRPGDFEETAARYLRATGTDPERNREALASERDRMFYRTQEIRTRAWLINDVLQPDLVLCLHFNAESWGSPQQPRFVDSNHLHLLVNGAYGVSEMRLHDQCFDMLQRMLQRTHAEELAVSTVVAESMARETGLPAFRYGGSNARAVGDSDYVWARNLLANRIYDCPTVFLEPYVMNNQQVHDRIREGDYSGIRSVGGIRCKSIFREYADGVADGVRRYYTRARGRR